MVKVSPDLRARPADETGRTLALARLDEASSALERLADSEDAEALHDFRVAVRRLRSFLRAYRRYLKGAGAQKARRRLRDVMAATGGARDAEVHLAWLRGQEKSLSARERAGVRWLIDRLESRAARSSIEPQLKLDFQRIERRLRARLPVYAVEIHLGRGPTRPTWDAATGELVRAHGIDLREHLAQVDSVERREEGHAARIRCKRLRYLLEPLQDEEPAARELVKRLKELQDLLGEWHDLYVLGGQIAAALETVSAERARQLYEAALAGGEEERRVRAAQRRDERPGLLSLARRAREGEEKLFRSFRRRWSGSAAKASFEKVDGLAARLEARTVRLTEIERKYLLDRLPEVVADAPSVEIDQGWLPGARLEERVRRVRAPDGDRHYRTVKIGGGIERTELEEEASAETFEALWPLTEGRRVRKRRYRVADGAHTWEIDAFADRDLVLAEVELDRRDQEVRIPDWLRPRLVREVTGEAEYLNVRLAR